MSGNFYSPDEVVWIGGNDFGYLFAVARSGDQWQGFARGEMPENSETEAMIFFFPLEAETDRRQAILKTVAYVEFGENGYGGVSRWFEEFADDEEVKTATYQDFVCDECRREFCEGECRTRDDFYGVSASNFV